MTTRPRAARWRRLLIGGLLFGALAGTHLLWAQYPPGLEIVKDGTAVRLQDYASVPLSSVTAGAYPPPFNPAGQLARVNFLRSEPAPAPASSVRFFVSDSTRNLYILDKATATFTPYLNFEEIFPKFVNTPGFSGGLVTFAFGPDYAGDGTFYTVHLENPSKSGATAPTGAATPGLDLSGYQTTSAVNPPAGSVVRQAILVEWTDTDISDSTFQGTAREVLRVGFTATMHPMGDLLFNPIAYPGHADYGNLYISVGDGGAGELTQPAVQSIPQRLDALQGKILRITPDITLRTGDLLSPNGRYRIPTTGPDPNPFVSLSLDNLRKEIYAYGFRNPFRMSWDAVSNLLIVNDIGLNAWEEVNLVIKGANYGYPRREGPEQHSIVSSNRGRTGSQNSPPTPFPNPDTLAVTGLASPVVPVYPVIAYSHHEGDAISSGFVYRGTLMPHLYGKYIFGDITTGRLFHADLSSMMAATRTSRAVVREIQVVYDSPYDGAGAVNRRLYDIVADAYAARGGDPSPSSSQGVLPGNGTVVGGPAPGRLDIEGVRYGGGRADIRLVEGGDGEIYILSKSDGMIRAVVPLEEPTSDPPAQDFTVMAAPAAATTTPGGGAGYTVTIGQANGFAGTVSLSAANLPAGASAVFTPATISGGESATLSITTDPSTPLGGTTLTVIGTGGGLTRTADVTLVVSPAPDFTLTVLPVTASAIAGGSASYSVAIGSLNGFAGTVHMAASGLPTGASASFTPATVTGSGTVALTVATTGSTPAGGTSFTVTATGGALTRTADVPLTVSLPAPVAEFVATPLSGVAPLTVTFTDQSINGPSTWAWAFGDGATSTARHPTHTYDAPGLYTVRLTAANGSGTHTLERTGYVTVADAPAAGGGGMVSFETALSGSASGSSVTTSMAFGAAPAGQVFLAAVATRPYRPVTAVSGLNLAWTRVEARCGGRNQTGVEVWMAQGPTAGGVVTATWSGSASNAVITVSAYSGAAIVNPVGAAVSANTNGTNGSCSGGIDNNGYALGVTPSVPNAVVYSAVTMRNRPHTPGTGYTERQEVAQGAGGDVVSLATQDQRFAAAAPVVVNGTFGGAVDWAAIALEIRPGGEGSPTLVAAFDADVTNGVAPLTVSFADRSSGSPTAWSWDFGDGIGSAERGAVHTYAAGTHTVTLTVTKGAQSATETKTAYITVADPPPADDPPVDDPPVDDPPADDPPVDDPPVDDPPVDGGGGAVTFEQARSGGVSGSATVATAGPLSPAGQVFLAAVSSKPYRPVTGVTGLGLTWTRVAAQCGGRNQTGVDVWMAHGASAGGVVTATLSASTSNAVIAVSAYAGAAAVSPLGAAVSANTNGPSGGCAGGTDGSAYSVTMPPGALVFSAVAMRNRTHTPGATYTERQEVAWGTGGDAVSVATQDRLSAVPPAVLAGTLGNTVDWAVIAVEIRPRE